MRSRSTLVVVARQAALAFFLGLGTWQFLSPGSFYDALAFYPPFNAHFLRDGGAFTIGIGVGLLVAPRWGDGLAVALTGAAAAAVMHAISHIVDAGAGGRTSDPWLLSGFALIVAAGAISRIKEVAR